MTYKANRPLKVKEIANEIGVSADDYNSFRSLVKEMVNEGRLVKLRRGRIGIPSELNLVVGNISITRQGKGTVVTETGDSIDVEPNKLHTALDGDKVMLRVGTHPERPKSGAIIRVLERAHKNIVGIFRKGRNFSTVIPDDKRFRRDIYIPGRRAKRARDGDRVVVTITSWEEPYQNPEGRIVEVLGDPEQPGVDILTVIKKYNLPETFPDQIIREAESIDTKILGQEARRRKNFSHEIAYTIDPADAKDHDDAISVRKIRGGYRLGVYIADVSFFVAPGGKLDKEAFDRGNSVYLPGEVIPMLPEKLSNDLCSLKPHRRRLVMAVIIDFDSAGKVKKTQITEAIITSRAKLSYEEVQDFFNTGRAGKRIEKVAPSLLLAKELASLLQKNRMKNGSLDFDLPEARIVMNKKGEVVEIGNRVRLESHRLIEEFMLTANQAVAMHFTRHAAKLLYRVHDRPDMEKLNAFSYMMSTLGYKFPVSENMKPIQFARFLDKIKSRPEEGLINELMLRSMQKAVYQPKNIGHFGLAFKHYAHFTSPIRRYPDLIVHRLLRQLKNGRYPVALDKKLGSILTHVGKHCSETERNAEAAEREAVRYKQTIFMKQRLGEEYKGVISGVLSFGFFVRLNTMGAEGMVRLSSINDDYYSFDESHHRLVGRRTGRIFRMGDPVTVSVVGVDVAKNEINLALVEAESEYYQPRMKKKRRRR
jgi:ribonuclease R